MAGFDTSMTGSVGPSGLDLGGSGSQYAADAPAPIQLTQAGPNAANDVEGSQGAQYADAGNVATDAQIVGPGGSPLSQAVDAVLQDGAIPDEVFDQLSLRDVFRIADTRVRRATEQAGSNILRQENARVLGKKLKLARGSILLAIGAPAFEGGMLAAGRVGRTFGELSAKALGVGVSAATPSASGFSPGLLRNGLSLVRGVAQPGLP
jgi:hypothetical protein